MAKHASDNLHIKRKYTVWLRDAKGLSEATVDKAAAALDRWLEFIKGADLRKFHSEKAVAFKRKLERETSALGRPLSDASRESVLRELKAFFLWLADQPGYRSKIRHTDAEWFTPDRRIARSSHQGLWRPHPSPQQVERAIDGMPTRTVFERRNRALLALIYLTGSRVTAAMTLRLRHIDLDGCCLHFGGQDVRTNFGKRFTVFFFPVGQRFEVILSAWVSELREDQLFGTGDPVFPKTELGLSISGYFEPVGLLRQPWRGSGKVAAVVKAAFEDVGLPPF